MNLFEKIQADLKQAMKDKDSDTLNVLRLLISSIKNTMIEAKQELDDAEVVAAVKRDVKKLQDAAKDFAAGAREDLLQKTRDEIAILQKYLPPEISDEELAKRTKEILAREGLSSKADMGKAMGVVMKELQGEADGNRVRAVVEESLQ